MNSTVQQTVANGTKAVEVLQAVRREHEFGNVAYRILDAAISHLIGRRPSSVDFAPSLEVK